MDESSVLIEFAAVQKRPNLNEYDKKFVANILCRILEGKDLTDKQAELLHRMYVGPTSAQKERTQRVGYTLINNSTGQKVYL